MKVAGGLPNRGSKLYLVIFDTIYLQFAKVFRGAKS
jgi:hypothetical protein